MIERVCECVCEGSSLDLVNAGGSDKFSLIKVNNPLMIVFKETCLSLLRDIRTYVFLVS